MMPMYMNSSQPGQMRPQGCYHQGFGNYPHHMDASSPASCENWPTPSPFYGNCYHGTFPAYTPYWPPCYPPQIPHHTCCVNHSGFYPHAPYYIHQSFPVGCQPGYFESDKDVTGKHRCTKCSPQMCYPKNDRSVVIEEHEPEIEKGDHGEAVNNVRSTNCPYPIICIPHENARNQEHGSYDQPPVESKVPESTKVVQKGDSNSWTGCFPFDENTVKSLIHDQDWKKMQNGKTVELPFDISKLKSLLRGQEGKDVQIQKNKEPGEHQYPIFWIPSHGKLEDVEASEKREHSNEGRNLKSSSSNHLNESQITQGNKGSFESNVLSDAEERSLMRNIPLKKYIQEPRNIPVKLVENHLSKPAEPTKRNAKTELVENTEKEQRLSPSKASRLPPVCLRVDPLPKRKKGGFKSLSPPRRNEQTLTSEETKVTSPMSFKKAETRTVPEACNVTCEEANKEKKMSEGRPNSTGTEKGSVESITKLHAGANCEIVKPCEAKENKEEPAKKTLREEEAARVIQSRYRGYDVRRWEPIKKLKEIAHVRKQMDDVKKRIQALEVSSTDQDIEGKEIIILGEMVMSLLLKLDSVQGLHPSIRDFRKSLARELSDMQENLDSLKKSAVEKGDVEEQVEITSQSSECPVNMEPSQIVGGDKMVPDSNAEKVLPPSPEEYPMSLKNTTDEQLLDEAEEEVIGLSETLATEPEPAVETGISEADSTSPGKSEAVETLLPVNPSSAIGNELLVTNIEEDVVEKLEVPPHELPQVVETTGGLGCEGPENATEVSETVANASEKNEDRKGDNDTVLLLEKNLEFSELPFGVVNYETQLLSQDSSSCTWEAEKNEIDPETESQEEVNVDNSCDHSKGIGQETAAPHEDIEQHPETEVREHEMLEETKKLMEENQRFKETVETLVKAGREQLEVISKLTGRVKSLEKKMLQKKRTHVGRRKPICGKYATKPMSSTAL